MDNGDPPNHSFAHILVKVASIPIKSAHAPTIENPPNAHVMVTDRPGHVLGFIGAYDLDNDTLWYSIERRWYIVYYNIFIYHVIMNVYYCCIRHILLVYHILFVISLFISFCHI